MTTGPMNFHLVDSYFNDICAIKNLYALKVMTTPVRFPIC